MDRQQQLSADGREAFKSFNRLSTEEKGNFIALASIVLAAETSRKVSTATDEQLAQAASIISKAIQAARAHDFKQVAAPDGTSAIEVKIRRANGQDVTCLLSEGARGNPYRELADYGRTKLQGATLLFHADFKAVVESLYYAIRGLRVGNEVLQTEDVALRQAYQIVTQGVRTDGRFSWASFDLDEEGAVADRRVHVCGHDWRVFDHLSHCALFDGSPEESK